MSTKSWLIALVVWPLAALAQNEQQLVERYTALAGSKENAIALVTGLRDGKDVTLTRGTASETFSPPTGKMGYGNVDHALALAERSLQQQKLADPTPAQLAAAVNDVLGMRADGLGWGRIAQKLDIKLGDVKRADKASERVARVERPNRPEKPERPEKPQRPERPERPERSK